MLTVRATLKDQRIEFDPEFTPPSERVAVLVTFVEDAPTSPTEPAPTGLLSDRFHWDEALALTKNLGGKPASQICIEDRENDWR